MESFTNKELLAEIGSRLRRERMNQDLTQDMLADRTGLRQATISRVERGHDFTVETMIEILRALDRLESLDAFLPAPSPSPIELAQRQGHERQRVRRRRSDDSGETEWQWGDGN